MLVTKRHNKDTLLVYTVENEDANSWKREKKK